MTQELSYLKPEKSIMLFAGLFSEVPDKKWILRGKIF
jgi:hypothetical protein